MDCATDSKKRALSPCCEACPAGIDVPRYIRHIQNGEFDEALATICEKIPFPSVCGYACTAYCELKCARTQYDEAIAIRLLKRAAAEFGTRGAQRENAAASGKKVAVIGAGPSGLTAACNLVLKGHQVTVFESLPEPGGMLRYGIPEYRLANSVVEQEISLIRDHGVKIETDTRIDSPAKLLEKGFAAVLLATGAWRPQKMGIEGEELSHVLDGISFLKDVNSGKHLAVGKRVVVVGGGNTAIDAARCAIRLGADVDLLYRRTRAEMTASAEELLEAVEEGVSINFLTAPVKISSFSVECVRMELGASDVGGRPQPFPVEKSEYSIKCDTVIMATGQLADAGIMGLTANHDGTVMVDGDLLELTNQGIYAAGDVVSGSSSIIEAIALGRKASSSIDIYLGGDGIIDRDEKLATDSIIPDSEPRGTTRLDVAKAVLESRLCGFAYTENGYDMKSAMGEARRCLSCDMRYYSIEVNSVLCKACGYCKEVCTLELFQHSDAFNPSGYHPMFVEKSDRCVGCLNCLYICPDFAIQITENVNLTHYN